MKSSPLRRAKFQPAPWVSVWSVVSTTKLIAGLSAFTGAMRGPLGAAAGAALLGFELIEPALDPLERALGGGELLLGGSELGLHRVVVLFRHRGRAR